MSILFRSAFEMAKGIKKGELTSSEVLEFYLKRIEQYNPSINAVVQLDSVRALSRAKEADAAAARSKLPACGWGRVAGMHCNNLKKSVCIGWLLWWEAKVPAIEFPLSLKKYFLPDPWRTI
jgi:hypothetical protein